MADRRPAERYALWVVRLRYPIVLAWIAAAVLTTARLPGLGEASGGALGSLVPEDARALATQFRSGDLFRVPVLTNTLVVQRDEDGLAPAAQARAVARAATIIRRGYPDLLSVPFAIPLVNTLGLVPGSREAGTTALTYLYFERQVGLQNRDKLAHWFTDRRITDPGDALVGVTGVVPARVEQGRLIQDALPLIELATVLLIAVVIGLNFRAVGAPLLTLVTVGLAYAIALRVVGAVGREIGVAAPRELEPIVLVLVLGIVTDYCIFFLSGFRGRLLEGRTRLESARGATGQFTPIIVTAGLIVAAGTASLLAAELEFFRIFGPALALTVLVGLAVSVTFVPALLAILGRSVYWPSRVRPVRQRRPLWGTRVGRLVHSRRIAGVFVALCAAALGAASYPLLDAHLTLTPIESLPEDSEPKRAARAAAEGFAPGVLSPTLVLLERPGLADDRDRLVELQGLVAAQPGVAGVIGPRQAPPGVALGAVIAPGGSAARFILFLEEEPLGRAALQDLRELRDAFPDLLAEAGLSGAFYGFGGNTALADETVSTILEDLVRISIVVLCVNLVFLVVFLRSLVAPVYLLAASVLALTATLGLTTLLFQELLGYGELTYYVPFMAAVLLVSLGSDYNVFLVGRVWQEARRRPLAEAVAVAAPRASQAISAAGLALASSFALLALVPLGSFREFAFAMFVGVLLDAFVVRAYLVPAILALAGPRAGWPGRLHPRRPADAPSR